MKKLVLITIFSSFFLSAHAQKPTLHRHFTQKLNGFTYRVYYEGYYTSWHDLMGNLIINPFNNSLADYESCSYSPMYSISCYNTLFMHSDFEIEKFIMENQHHFSFRYQEDASDYSNFVILESHPIDVIKSI